MKKELAARNLKKYIKPSLRSKKINFVLSAAGTAGPTPVPSTVNSGFGPYRDAPRR